MSQLERERGRGTKPRGRGNHQPLPRYDQELRNAKNDGKTVELCLNVDTPHTNEDCVVQGKVLEVDKFDVKLELGAAMGGRKIWFKKANIVATEVC